MIKAFQNIQHVHCVGIGGIGISALARYFRVAKITVSGSDAYDSSIIDSLRKEGIACSVGRAEKNLPSGTDLLVYSSAVTQKNSERRAAEHAGIRTLSYAEAVGVLTQMYTTIAISGSHGKSTTTALIALMLTRAGFDPTVIVGTNLKEFEGTNFRMGKSKYFVLEADEWNKSFHHYYPTIAVITNVDKEHLDTYKTHAGVIAGFARYFKNLEKGGVVIANGKDAGTRQAVKRAKVPVIWYNQKTFPRHTLGIPGRHNQENAEAAWTVGKYLGISKTIAEKTFRKYRGSWRRFEELTPRKGSGIRARIVTDYAHHPTEIRATLAAAREAFPRKRIVAVLEPHHSDRLSQLFQEFAAAFSDADKVILLPVYKVLGRDGKNYTKDSHALVRAMKREHAIYAPSFRSAFSILGKDFQDPQTVIIFMSAGSLDSNVRDFVRA